MIIEFVVVALATATISYTLTKSTLFEDIRWKFQYSAEGNKKDTKLADFVGCPYCVSHWVALLLVLLLDLRVVDTGNAWYDLVLCYTVTAFSVVATATAVGAVIHRAYNPPVTQYKEIK